MCVYVESLSMKQNCETFYVSLILAVSENHGEKIEKVKVYLFAWFSVYVKHLSLSEKDV